MRDHAQREFLRIDQQERSRWPMDMRHNNAAVYLEAREWSERQAAQLVKDIGDGTFKARFMAKLEAKHL